MVWGLNDGGELARTHLPNLRINTSVLLQKGGDVMSAQTHGPCLPAAGCRRRQRCPQRWVWLMTSQIDVFADPFPDRHQLTLGMMWRCRDSTTPSQHSQVLVTQGHKRIVAKGWAKPAFRYCLALPFTRDRSPRWARARQSPAPTAHLRRVWRCQEQHGDNPSSICCCHYGLCFDNVASGVTSPLDEDRDHCTRPPVVHSRVRSGK